MQAELAPYTQMRSVKQSIPSATATKLVFSLETVRRVMLRNGTASDFYIGHDNTVDTTFYTLESGTNTPSVLNLDINYAVEVWVYQNSGGPLTLTWLELA